MDLPPELCLGAIMEREDPRDMFLSLRHANPDALPPGARVGTSSMRRQAQILSVRPDLAVIPLRGNVDTRLGKLAAGEFDAIIMASAGMKRLGLSAPHMVPIPERILLPAAGQGALGVECRSDRTDLAEILTFLDHGPTHTAVMAERGFLAGLDGGCQAPMAAHAVIEKGTLSLEGMLCGLDGKRAYRQTADMDASLGPVKAHSLGLRLADAVKSSGGEDLLAEIFASVDN